MFQVSKEEGQRQTEGLVEKFQRNIKTYKSPAYNEENVRVEFINPFFEALGWDVRNVSGYAEAYKDVVHEETIRVGRGAHEAPDYTFRVGGSRVFFVEAKKPAMNIRDDPRLEYQLRRYGWSAGLKFSILTDFEEFAVYDCRFKPGEKDKVGTGRVRYLRFEEYLDKFNEIHGLFGREAVLQGSFDRYADETKRLRGTAPVDKEFLKEIERWREFLARNIALRNPQLDVYELNFAVQRTVDRIIFLRICEDRGIEEYGRLQALGAGTNAYERLLERFDRAEERYNSGLFHFEIERGQTTEPDKLTPALKIDDKALQEIFKGLYYPESPYEFSVIGADILGQVYEQFLGKVIRLTPGHRAKVEEKPEVRKAGGVYYTPTYIVDYIVKNTIGKLCRGENPSTPEGGHSSSPQKLLTPKQVKKLRILDPACGSGSFLIGAYQYLLDYCRDWYVDDGPEKHKKRIYQGKGGLWFLTPAEKKEILLNCIYGVDIDHQAVEVTKLNLLLKALEGESRESVESQRRLFQERALPDLGDNIKCGNSLIGTDFYEHHQDKLFDDDEIRRINPFDWHTEFPEIMKNGGFHAVIGNPPYVRQETLGTEFKEYAKNNFEAYAGTADLYVYFIEQSHRVLQDGGFFGMICSNKFMRAKYGKALRDFLVNKTSLEEIVDFGELPVFQDSSTFAAIFLTQNKKVQDQQFVYAPIKRLNFHSLPDEVHQIGSTLDNRSITGEGWTLANVEEVAIFEKMQNVGIPLGKYVNGQIHYGIKTGLNKAFVINRETRDKLISEDPKSVEIIKPFIMGDDVRKYHVNFKENYLILIPNGWTRKHVRDSKSAWEWFKSTYSAVANHLQSFSIAANKRWDKGEFWWELRPCDYYFEFEKPKIIYPDISKASRLTLDRDGFFCSNTCYFIPKDDPFLLGILNSKLIFFYYKRFAAVLGDADKGGRMRWFTQDVLQLPIRPIDFSSNIDKERHGRITNLVEHMLSLNKQLLKSQTDHEKNTIQRQISVYDRQIDRLVYELYGLTDEETRIVEENLISK